MFAVTITKNGQFYRFIGFAKDQAEVEEIAQKIVEKYGKDYLNEHGYRVCAELAI